jgi:protein SCO1/2
VIRGKTLTRQLLIFIPLIALAFSAGAVEDHELRSGVFSPPRAAPEFSLQGSDGSEIKLSHYRGKVVALGFGYTFCPDVCPTTLLELAQARKKLGTVGKEFQVVYVTVDPERDSAERLRKYLAAFDPSFIGATGTPERLADVRKAYGILVSKKTFPDSPSAYLVHHSSYVYLIDRDGKLCAIRPFGSSIDDLVHDVTALLNGERK